MSDDPAVDPDGVPFGNPIDPTLNDTGMQAPHRADHEGFAMPDVDPSDVAVRLLIDEWIRTTRDGRMMSPEQLQTARTLMPQIDEKLKVALLLTLVKREFWHDHGTWNLLEVLLAEDLTFREDQIIRLLELRIAYYETKPWLSGKWSAHGSLYQYRELLYGTWLLIDVKNHIAANGITPQVWALLQRLLQIPRSPDDKASSMLADLLGFGGLNLMPPGSRWADTALQELTQMEPVQQEVWLNLLRLCGTEDEAASAPTRWLQEAEQRIDTIGNTEVQRCLVGWLSLVGAPVGRWYPNDEEMLWLRGLVWIASLLGSSQTCRLVGQIAELCEEGHLTILRHACYHALGAMPGMEPLAIMARLLPKVKNRQSQKVLSKAFGGAVKRAGLSRDDVEDLTVPTFDLDSTGRIRQQIGDWGVEIAFAGEIKGIWKWFSGDSKPQKSVPPDVRNNSRKELEALKAYVAEIEKMRQFQCERIERLYCGKHDWRLNDWRQRYCEHPLLTDFARRLIWQVEEGDRLVLAIWDGEWLVDVTGSALDWPTAAACVRLWHPVGTVVETVLAWRARLAELGIQQPFRQAYREAYLLTDAERETDTYSNRFAAHILQQYPFKTLCRKMGWRNRILYVNRALDRRAIYPLPEWDLQAEFWVEPIDDPKSRSGEYANYYYLSTDQVRFVDAKGQAVSLSGVPAQLFWEIMRDVDLLVTHASITHDPNWRDRGANLTLTGSASHAFYEGHALGVTERHAILEKLLPRLNVAARCTLDDTFVIVRGEIRTYKIHLGTGHVFMEPNDQYLCIIRSRTQEAEPDFNAALLPFEGDSTLELILSKLILLTNDRSIKDPVILRQLRL